MESIGRQRGVESIGDRIRRERVLVLIVAGLVLAGLVLGVASLAIGEGAYDVAVLVLIALGAVALLPFSVSLSFTYTCAALPAVIALNRHGGPWGPGRLTLYGLLLLYMVVGLATWFRSTPRRTPIRAAGWAMVLFVVYLLVVSLAANDQEAALEAWVNHAYHWPFLLLPTLLLRRAAHVRVLFLYVAGLGALLALASIAVTFLLSDPSAILAHGGRYQRVHLYFGTANTLGLFLAISLFVLLYAVPVEQRLLRVLKTGVQVMLLIAILLTFSRRTWLATGALLLFHYLWKRDWRAVVLVVLVSAALGYQMREQIGQRAESMIDPEHSSNIERQREVTEHLDFLFGDGVSATGWGMDRAVAASGADMTRVLYFHNYYLTIYYLAGAIGLVLFLVLAGAMASGLRKLQRLARGPTAGYAASAGLAVLAIVLVTGLFGNANVTFPVNYFGALVPGLAFAAMAVEKDEASDAARGGSDAP